MKIKGKTKDQLLRYVRRHEHDGVRNHKVEHARCRLRRMGA